MSHNLENTVALLARTPAALDALLRGLPETWTRRNEGEGTFTVFDVVGHLIYADKFDWMSRARMIGSTLAGQWMSSPILTLLGFSPISAPHSYAIRRGWRTASRFVRAPLRSSIAIP